jgi:hypothetical protein
MQGKPCPRHAKTYLSTVGLFNNELVLQHDKVTLARRIGHERLQACTECVEQITRTRNKRLVREKPDPAKARNNAHSLDRIGERTKRFDTRYQGAEKKKIESGRKERRKAASPLRGCVGARGTFRGLSPRKAFLDPLLGLGIEPAELDECPNKFGEALIAQCTAHDSVRLWDVVPLTVWS